MRAQATKGRDRRGDEAESGDEFIFFCFLSYDGEVQNWVEALATLTKGRYMTDANVDETRLADGVDTVDREERRGDS